MCIFDLTTFRTAQRAQLPATLGAGLREPVPPALWLPYSSPCPSRSRPNQRTSAMNAFASVSLSVEERARCRRFCKNEDGALAGRPPLDASLFIRFISSCFFGLTAWNGNTRASSVVMTPDCRRATEGESRGRSPSAPLSHSDRYDSERPLLSGVIHES
jgi:hypothetical protein